MDGPVQWNCVHHLYESGVSQWTKLLNGIEWSEVNKTCSCASKTEQSQQASGVSLQRVWTIGFFLRNFVVFVEQKISHW
jgi:hypothetical protein